MLDWIKGSEQGASAADDSKLLEAPETPAPVFAIRAFKSALFGTPGAEEEENEEKERVSQPKKQTMGHQRSQSDSIQQPTVKMGEEDENTKPSDPDAINPGASPTKSILVTPGTMSSRRKTVSFGKSVVDNERKEGSPRKVAKTPPNPAGNLSIQWTSGSSDGSKKPRSKLTQTLLDARNNASENTASVKSTEHLSSDPTPTARPQSKEETSNEDITINLEEPRSESGKYWKSEFDNYRVRTNREIKKLIHYRSIAKSYARKKDSEALRLADKLREEEEKVAEMERHVTRLAATMAGEGSKAGKEQLVQDLTKQTALALQYKQQVTSLRKLLERHNVISGDVPTVAEQRKEDSASENATDLRKMQQALDQTNAKVKEMGPQQSDLGMLQDLAQSSQKKAQELEKENITLKQTLARVKQEMSRYEGRRKDKETKLKQREAKLEGRIQEYRERLKTTSQEHREAEATLRSTFDEERRRMQDQIDLLKLRVAATERYPATLRSRERHSHSPRRDYTGVQVLDFAGQEHPVEIGGEDGTTDLDAPPSPSPRSKTRESRQQARYATNDAHGTRRSARPITAEDDEVTHYLNEILPRPPQTRLTHHHAAASDSVPPSSPPDMPVMRSLRRHSTKQPQLADGQSIHPPSRYMPGTDDSAPLRAPSARQRSHIKSTLDSISGVPASRPGSYAGHPLASHGKRHAAGDDGQKEYLSPERVAAAKSRLKQKYDNRKNRALGKENLRMMAVSSGAGSG